MAGKNWIAGAVKKPGALRAELGVKGDKPIPAAKLAKAAAAGGKLGQRARLAETFRKFGTGGAVAEKADKAADKKAGKKESPAEERQDEKMGYAMGGARRRMRPK